ncbi:heat shock protein GrpE [Nocardioides dokdonensis FR1436]|uniref:Protein GrpE n=1 Tax=Nocardioides dokdonensis FR1436 TaxID=1300347 RepID=A0A1A9GGI4_9ACTN|nr:nucleotide exchange factor GrpE [Nocardioides dokdonensis]ANH37388.1 heat shock protein GrpE [Nocardioides dokdonensis FR1436]
MTEPRDDQNIPPPEGSFPAEAAEMTEDTEVEEGASGGEPSVGTDPEAPRSEVDAADDELTLARIALEERTLDLQRLQAEFVNYKRRVERDRELIKENATYAALAPITEVLDTIDRARDSADKTGAALDGGFKAVAEQLEHTVGKAGLIRYGAPGDAFDPRFHEALSHIGEDPEVSVTTCKVIAKAGYRIGDRVVRAAQVLVVDPADGPASADGGEPTGDADEDVS